MRAYVRVNFRDVTTGARWSWRMRADVAQARDGVRVEVLP